MANPLNLMLEIRVVNRIRGSFSLPLSTPPTASGSAPGGS